MNKLISCIFFILLTAVVANSEGIDTWTLINELKLSFNNQELKRIEKFNSLISAGNQLVEEAYNMQGLDEGYAKMDEAKKNYENAFKMANHIFGKYIDEFYEELKGYYRDELGRAQHFEGKAKNFHDRAEHNLRLYEMGGNYSERYNHLIEGLEFLALSIVNNARAVRIYQDWPVEYPYIWDDYIPPKDLLAEEERVIEKAPVDTDIVAMVEKQTDTVFIDPFFRVQIAAHTREISRRELKTIYAGDEKVDMIQEDGWYKYQIGFFTSFKEASKLLKKTHVEKAFIVAYDKKTGKRVQTREAIRIASMKEEEDK